MAQTEPLFDAFAPTASGNGRMLSAMTATLDELTRLGLLKPWHRADAELCLQLAASIDRATVTSKPYSVAMLAAQMGDRLDKLPKPEEEKSDAWDELVAALRAAETGDSA